MSSGSFGRGAKAPRQISRSVEAPAGYRPCWQRPRASGQNPWHAKVTCAEAGHCCQAVLVGFAKLVAVCESEA